MGVATGLILASPSHPVSRPFPKALLVSSLSLSPLSLPPSILHCKSAFVPIFVRVQTESPEFELVESVLGEGLLQELTVPGVLAPPMAAHS